MEQVGRQLPKHFQNNLDLAFQFKLARELRMTVAELQTTMSALEYNQWVAYYDWETTRENKALALAEAERNKKKQR